MSDTQLCVAMSDTHMSATMSDTQLSAAMSDTQLSAAMTDTQLSVVKSAAQLCDACDNGDADAVVALLAVLTNKGGVNAAAHDNYLPCTDT